MVLCQGCTITPKYLALILFYFLYANIQTEEYFQKIDMIRELTFFVYANQYIPNSTQFDNKTKTLSNIRKFAFAFNIKIFILAMNKNASPFTYADF